MFSDICLPCVFGYVFLLLAVPSADVVTGQSGPILRSLPRLCPEIHGDSGLDCKEGGHIFGESLPTTKSISGKCVNVMFKRLSEAFTKSGRQKVSLVCTGPLTNCAILLLVYPEVQEMVEVVVMGGCMGIGNTGPVMEFNMQSDPEAAKIVFESGVHLTMVPLEVWNISTVFPTINLLYCMHSCLGGFCCCMAELFAPDLYILSLLFITSDGLVCVFT